ncbi:MAG: MBL fold metallo-hydrolase [Clostridia bacterium]|nr:MBL fold metallo-hydrolase [Clostridia bacterium]
MKLKFLGAAHEVTGSCTLLEAAGIRILIDCGMEQGADIYENCAMPILPAEVDLVVLTHAHIDHSGKLPMLVAGGFGGRIYATEATMRLCNLMLRDSAHIQEQEALWRNRRAKRSGEDAYVPLYTVEDAANTMSLFEPCGYHTVYEVAEGVSIRFLDAGHLLGSASIEITVTEGEKRHVLLFSGDLGNVDRPLIRNPEMPTYADTVIIESTYGDRLHGERKDYLGQLTAVLQETFDRGGNVVIPSFAVGRTQEFLYLLREIKEKGLVQGHEGFPVFVDSPMAGEATKIYFSDLYDYYDDAMLELVQKGINVLEFPGLQISQTTDESMAINFDKRPKVILSASGMCEAGRIRHHLKHNLWREDCTVLFVGYQAEGTLGRHLQDGAETVRMFGETVQVRAKIATMDGISGHADQAIMLRWLGSLKDCKPRVYVNHGNDGVCDAFAETIHATLGFPATAPYNGAVYDVESGLLLVEGNRVRLEKRTAKKSRNDTVYERLVQAGKRLLRIIEKCRGMSNKDLAKFTNQINQLSDKWEE